MNVDYSQAATPNGYKCGVCHVTGVKLWREYNVPGPALRCARCAAQEEHEDIRDMDDGGFHTSTAMRKRTDQIGEYVPAIPDEGGVGYCGYMSVPAAGVTWWRRLPHENNRKEDPA